MVLKICLADGSDIIVDGFDDISFYTYLPEANVTNSGYSWQKDHNELLNNLVNYNFICVKRHDSKDELVYRNHNFAFKNTNFEGNEPLILQTKCVTTIIDMYK